MTAKAKKVKSGVNNVRLNYVRQVSQGLEKIGARFKIIYDGREFGKYKPFPLVTQRKGKQKLPYGSLTGYARPFYDKAKPGDLIVIPPGKFNLRKLRATVVSDLSKRWGKGAHTSAIVKGKIEILRIPTQPE